MQGSKKDVAVGAANTFALDSATGLLKALFAVTLFAGLTFLGAGIRIPLQPVPITMQTLFVVLAGAMLGAGRASLSQLLYLSVGILGVPVFAGHVSGLSVLTGPTGGYLFGFIAAPVTVALLIQRRNSIRWTAMVFSLGALVILAMGTVHLALFYTHDLAGALRVGFLPFIPGEILKVLAATSIYKSFKALSRMKSRNGIKDKPF